MISFRDPNIMSIQESCRPLVAAASGRDASSLKLVPERCSVKVGSCPALGPHLDPHRQGGLQVVIALSSTVFQVWPKSHKVCVADRVKSRNFHLLSEEELARLPMGCEEILACRGDVLLMQGSVLVHGSPAVPLGGEPRIMTYARLDTDISNGQWRFISRDHFIIQPISFHDAHISCATRCWVGRLQRECSTCVQPFVLLQG